MIPLSDPGFDARAVTRVAHLSDPHLTVGPLASGPATGLFGALQTVLSLDPRPTAVVITGDLADHGDLASYEQLAGVLDGFPLPLHLGLGNHDDHDTALQVFGGTRFLAGGDTGHYVVDHPGASIVMLDSAQPGRHAGHLGTAQLDWLAATLNRRTTVPVLVCLHHPPVPVGIPVLDEIRLENSDDLRDVLAGRNQPLRVLTGHVHRHITAQFAGTIVSIAPSTYRQVELTLRADRPTRYVLDPAGFLLHLTGHDGSWITHAVPTHGSAPHGTV